MRKFILSICLYTAAASLVFAQEPVFGYVYSRTSRFAPEPVDNYKYQIAQRIFDQLIAARGDFRMPKPTLVMNNGERYVAWMNPEERVIGIEEKAYDVCRRLGKDSLNAVAALLAHELIHYYEKHDWTRHFINLNRNLTTSAEIGQLKEGLKLETQADYLGGILALSAGYNTYGVLEELLKQAYESYGLPSQIDGYPSLEERLQLGKNTAEQLRDIHGVYQTANLLSLIDMREAANAYYDFILGDYQSYEIYNNAGVNALLAALSYYEDAEMPFALPVELDLTSRLDQLATRLPADAEAKRRALLRDAHRWFESAIQLAPAEPVAYLNRAVAHTLEKAWMDARYWASKAVELGREQQASKQIADAQIALGVIAALQEENEAAEAYFREARKGNEAMAAFNLALLKKQPALRTSQVRPAEGVEMIDKLFLDDFLAAPEFTTQVEVSQGVYCGRKEAKQTRLLMHYAEEGKTYALFHQTRPDYPGSTQWGIQLGASRAEILDVYQSPTRVLELSDGACLVYQDKNILFILNETDRLKHWVIFRKKP